MDAGVHKISAEEYHRDPAPAPSLSAGVAHRILTQCSKHAWFAHPRLNPEYQSEDKTEYDLGACSHAVLLEGEGGIEAINASDWRKAEAKEARAQARQRGQIPVLAHKMPEIRAMAAAARLALAECDLGAIDLSTGVAERTLIWQEGPVWCRARPDWMSADRSLLIDYKSTAGSANPAAWIRNQMVPLGFDMQSVHYRRGNFKTGGKEHAQWLFLVQENYPPFECSFIGLAPGMEEIAERKWHEARGLWQNCMATGKWMGYPRRVAYAEPMPWQIAEHEERMPLEDRAQI